METLKQNKKSKHSVTNNYHKADIYFGLVVFTVAVVLFSFTLKWPKSAALFPQMVSILMAVLGLTLGIKAYKISRKQKSIPLFTDFKKVVLIWLMLFVYYLSVDWLGFVLATLIFIPLTSWVFQYRNLKITILFTLIFIVIIYLIFGVLFDRSLPFGVFQVFFN